MSWSVASLCSDRIFGSPVRKQIIMFMADKASDDGSGIWCSKGTVVRHTELGETTVKRAINEFINEGILTETGRRKCANGYTVIYQMDLVEVERLESTDQPSQDTPSRADGVHSGTGTGSRPDPKPPINHP